MSKHTRFLFILALAAVFSLGTASANVVPITVNNPSFETLPGGGLNQNGPCNLTYSVAAIPGWNSTGVSGQFNPGTPGCVFNSIPDGSIVAETNGGTISQTVGVTVVAGNTYTLTVFQGTRLDCCTSGGATEDLLINGNTYLATGTAPTAGNWSQYSVTYVGTVADAGQSITIQLNGTGTQADFDDVTLSYVPSAVPEPGYLALTAGLGGLMVVVRRRSAKQRQ